MLDFFGCHSCREWRRPRSRRLLGHGIVLTAAFVAFSCARGADDALNVHTVTYKEVDGVKIEVDVYRPDDEVVRPVVVSIHGGALMMGNRKGIHNKLRDFCQQEGLAIVSIDYAWHPRSKCLRSSRTCRTLSDGSTEREPGNSTSIRKKWPSLAGRPADTSR